MSKKAAKRQARPKRTDAQQTRVREAFQAWLDASTAWSALNRSLHMDNHAATLAEHDKLRSLAKRVNQAAERFERSQEDCNNRP